MLEASGGGNYEAQDERDQRIWGNYEAQDEHDPTDLTRDLRDILDKSTISENTDEEIDFGDLSGDDLKGIDRVVISL